MMGFRLRLDGRFLLRCIDRTELEQMIREHGFIVSDS